VNGSPLSEKSGKGPLGTDSIIYINVIHTRSYMLNNGTPFCKTRPASVVSDHQPVLGEGDKSRPRSSAEKKKKNLGLY